MSWHFKTFFLQERQHFELYLSLSKLVARVFVIKILLNGREQALDYTSTRPFVAFMIWHCIYSIVLHHVQYYYTVEATGSRSKVKYRCQCISWTHIGNTNKHFTANRTIIYINLIQSVRPIHIAFSYIRSNSLLRASTIIKCEQHYWNCQQQPKLLGKSLLDTLCWFVDF